MINTDKYEGHTPAPWRVSPNSRYKIRADENLPEGVHHWHIAQVMNNRGGKWENMCKANAQLIADAPLLLEEVQRLQYLERYAPTFQVFAQNEEEMEEAYTQHGSEKECLDYIATLEDGWIGRIEVIEDFVLTNNPQIKTIEEWRGENEMA